MTRSQGVTEYRRLRGDGNQGSLAGMGERIQELLGFQMTKMTKNLKLRDIRVTYTSRA
jgi:hypothetical protein